MECSFFRKKIVKYGLDNSYLYDHKISLILKHGVNEEQQNFHKRTKTSDMFIIKVYSRSGSES